MKTPNLNPLTKETARARLEEYVALLPDKPFSDTGSGRGVVICGGGAKYLPCAWVCINMLRHLGCKLPIELWYLGRHEMPLAMETLFSRLDVRCVDSSDVRAGNRARILNGWELKPFAIIHSSFREVLLLDSDNVPVVDPSFLFDCKEYREAGAIFWPDYGRLRRSRDIWQLTGVTYRDEPEFETGQIVVDKQRCWEPLAITMWMNEHSDFFYKHIHGDKETFHMAWRKLDQSYAMPNFGIKSLSGTMCQHDFAGRRVFQHRNMQKWSLASNTSVAGFELEQNCLQFLEDLKPFARVLQGLPAFDAQVAGELAGKTVDYHRIGHDRRQMKLMEDGTIGDGQHRMERFWGVYIRDSKNVLEIYGDDGITARLLNHDVATDRWSGFWLIHERMVVEVTVMGREDRTHEDQEWHSKDAPRGACKNSP